MNHKFSRHRTELPRALVLRAPPERAVPYMKWRTSASTPQLSRQRQRFDNKSSTWHRTPSHFHTSNYNRVLGTTEYVLKTKALLAGPVVLASVCKIRRNHDSQQRSQAVQIGKHL